MTFKQVSENIERLRRSLAPDLSDAQSGRIAFLDGWRAVAIGLVIIAHTAWAYGITIPPFGMMGVYLFFGISGYIITRLLLLERHKTGKIDIPAFYIRRVARIVPPLALFLLAMVALSPDPATAWSSARGLAFTCNMGFGEGCITLIEHTWSLSFEEQFYLVYPLIVAGIWRWWLVPLIALWAIPFFLPLPFIGQGGFARIVMIMSMSAAYAAFESKLADQFARIPKPMILAMPLILFAWVVLEPSMTRKLLGVALPFAIILTLFALPANFPIIQRILSMGFMTRIGLYSYSFYLWQQYFTYPWSWNTGIIPILGILLAFALAALSYHTLEDGCRNWARNINLRRRAAIAETAG